MTTQALVTEARDWAKKLRRGALAELLVRLSNEMARPPARSGSTEIPGGYLHACSELKRVAGRIGGADGKACEAGALFLDELAREVFLGIRGPA